MALWKPIRGYEELYLISDEGEVYALPREIFNGRGKYFREGRTIKPYLRGRDGMKYYAICLCRDGIEERLSIHRLVAEAFVDNDDPLNHSVINHKDRNTLNNRADNLEWCDQQYNTEYGHNKRVGQFKDGVKVAEYKSISYASELTGIGRTSINNALAGWSETAGGYNWKYI